MPSFCALNAVIKGSVAGGVRQYMYTWFGDAWTTLRPRFYFLRGGDEVYFSVSEERQEFFGVEVFIFKKLIQKVYPYNSNPYVSSIKVAIFCIKFTFSHLEN